MLDFRLNSGHNEAHDAMRVAKEKSVAARVAIVDRYWSGTELPVRQRQRLVELLPFLTAERLERVIVPIVSMRSSVRSMRTLEWCVINYSRRFRVTLPVDGGETNLYKEYRRQLRSWGRDLFDVNRRGQRLWFDFAHADGYTSTYTTTVAQLNFFKWGEEFGVLRFLRDHFIDIERDMLETQAKARSIKADCLAEGVEVRRMDLSDPRPPKRLNKESAT